MFSKLLAESKALASLILVIIGVGITSYLLADCNAQAKYNGLIRANQSQHEEIVTTKNKQVNSLEKALQEVANEKFDLLSLVAELKDRPAEIEYITRTETILVPTDPEIIYADLPEEHIHSMQPGFPVAKFSRTSEGSYSFETYELRFSNTLVVGPKSTAALLQLESSGDPGVIHEIPVGIQVTRIQDRKFFEPHIGMGVTGLIEFPIAPQLTGSIYTSLLHPADQWDMLGVRLSANTEQLRIGIDAGGYNLGHKLPIFTDLWLVPGGSLGTTGLWSLDLTLGSKL
jgi:hypothetical protein